MRLDDLKADRDRIRTIVAANDKALADLLRRARFDTQPDGHPTSRRPNPGGGTNELTQPEAAAMRRIGHDEDNDGNPTTITPPADPLRNQLDDVLTWFAASRKISAKIDDILNGHTRLEAHQARSGYCEACTVHVTGAGADPIAGTPADRLQAGYCHTCYTAWWRAGHPDRNHFNHTRRQEACEHPPTATNGQVKRDA